jgi:cytochrome P450
VIAESMRLFPPAWILTRTLAADADFAGWHAPARTIVAVSPRARSRGSNTEHNRSTRNIPSC